MELPNTNPLWSCCVQSKFSIQIVNIASFQYSEFFFFHTGGKYSVYSVTYDVQA